MLEKCFLFLIGITGALVVGSNVVSFLSSHFLRTF